MFVTSAGLVIASWMDVSLILTLAGAALTLGVALVALLERFRARRRVKVSHSVAIEALREAIKEQADKAGSPDAESFLVEQVGKFRALDVSKDLPGTGGQTAPPDLDGRRILWVDDNPHNNTYESKVLENLGARVQAATSTQEALALLNDGKFDLIISDVYRVEGGQDVADAGYRLLEQVRQSGIKCPLMFYMSNVSLLDKGRSKGAAGVADIPSDLIDQVIRVIRGRGGPAAPDSAAPYDPPTATANP